MMQLSHRQHTLSPRSPTFTTVLLLCAALLISNCVRHNTGAAVLPVLPSLFPATGGMPVHASRINERLGQLVMLHLGEAVIGFAASQLQSTVQQFVGVGLAASLVWALHLLYYLVEPDEKSHAYRQSRARGLLFFYGHWLLCLALLLTGSGLRLLLGECMGIDMQKREGGREEVL